MKDEVDQLRSLLKQWNPSPPSKFVEKLISDVHDIVNENQEAMTILHETHYFHNVLWKFFEDASDAHIKLVLGLAVSEWKKYSTSAYIDTIIASSLDGFDTLLHKILAMALDKQKEAVEFLDILLAFRLQSKVVKKTVKHLFSEKIWSNLTLEKTQDVSEPDFKSEWLYKLLTNYTLASSELDFLKALLSLSVTILRQLPLRMNTKLLFEEVRFSASLKDPLLAAEAEQFRWYLNYPIDEFTGKEYDSSKISSERFAKVQAAVYAETDSIDLLLSKPSVFSTDRTFVENYFLSLSLEKLQSVLNKLKLTQNVHPHLQNSQLFLVSIVLDYIFVPDYAPNSIITSAFKSINETVVLSTFSSQLTYSQSLSSNDFLYKLLLQEIASFKSEISQHLKEVLTRVQITDIKLQAFKGSSKYFTPIESLEQNGSMLSIEEKTEKSDVPFIFLLELLKPNSMSPHENISQYGLCYLRCAETVEYNAGLAVETITGYERFKFIIRPSVQLQKTFKRIKLLALLIGSKPKQWLEDLIMGVENGSKVLERLEKTSDFLTNCIDSKTLEPLFSTNLSSSKKRKLDDGLTSVESDIKQVSFAEKEASVKSFPYTLNWKPANLNEQQSRVLLSAMNPGVTLVKTVPHAGLKVLVEQILEHWNFNFSRDRTLVVCPSAHYIQKFSTKDHRRWFKYDDSEDYIADLKSWNLKLMARVTKLAKALGLSGLAFDSDNENAVLLYELHLEPKWKKFLNEVSGSRVKDVFRAHFGGTKVKWTGDWTQDLQLAVEWYQDMRILFKDLLDLVPLLRFNGDQKLALYKFASVVFVSADDLVDLLELNLRFENIISLYGTSLQDTMPLLQNRFLSKAVLLGQKPQGLSEWFERSGVHPLLLDKIVYNARPEFITTGKLTGKVDFKYNPGFLETSQIVVLDAVADKVNPGEAQYAVALYQYMRLLGYPQEVITILFESPYQRILIERVLRQQRINENDKADDSRDNFVFGWPLLDKTDGFGSNDFVIASVHHHEPNNSKAVISKVRARAKLGAYFVGNIKSSDVYTGELQLCGMASYNRKKDGRKDGIHYQIEDVSQMTEYVHNMTKTRLGV